MLHMFQKNKIVYPLLLLLIMLTSNVALKAQQPNPNVDRIDEYLNRLVPFGFNGSVLVALDGNVLLNRGYGFADKSKDLKNDENTVFSMGSIVKPFTSVAIMKLYQDGELDLNDRLGEYFSNIPDEKANITIRQVLSHTSGLPGIVGSDKDNISREDALNAAFNRALAFEPSTGYQYSNVGFSLLAMIIEKVSGNSYEEFLNEFIFEPAGMKQTGYTIPEWDEQNLAHNYSKGMDNGTFLDREYYPNWNLIGNGGMLSTTSDMYKFIQYLNSNELLNQQTMETMYSAVVGQDALGWVALANGAIVEHNGGGMDGNNALLRWYRPDNMMFMIFSNSRIQEKPAFQVIQDPLNQMMFGEEPPLPPVISQNDEYTPGNISGVYQLENGGQLRISATETGFDYIALSQDAIDLIEFGASAEPGKNKTWNKDVESSISKFVDGDSKALNALVVNPDPLRSHIMQEIEMAGISNPFIKVMGTYSANEIQPGFIKTSVAVKETESSSNFLILELLFYNNQFAGMGATFGAEQPYTFAFISESEQSYKGYNLSTNSIKEVDITKGLGGRIASFSINGIKVPVVFKEN